ncbi:MAG TPA: hypothetical protein IGS53_11670 [Leptolyngbyaceae cyanobacterium M33_DOE_097]|uniref:DUF2993 domain-containing protein n=1 Tax=Oscillatoriales cyanobacterium SpSt-418 TaxID=2282169 RepID=A0A7C3KC13_9CYAN|nr:hypothetical protein [Leptolyngbyaceae cyanobacterium M33_DOE_097]
MNRMTLWLLGLTSLVVAQASWAVEFGEQPKTQKAPMDRRDRPATTVKEWIAQIEAETVPVTGVSIDLTDIGLEITLSTAVDILPPLKEWDS